MKTLAERFDHWTIPEPNSGCLLWLGAPTGQLGHGQLTINGRHVMASHIALMLAGRPLPAGMFACHRCDNPGCVNADHLFFGTQKDNVTDAITKGRHDISGLALGGGHNRKPPETRARARVLYEQGVSITKAARETGVSIPAMMEWYHSFGRKPRFHPAQLKQKS